MGNMLMRILRTKLHVLLFFLLLGVVGYGQPSNDAPCDAEPLTVQPANNCTPTVGNTLGSGAEMPAPVCIAYTPMDVWYTAVIPPSGSINVSIGNNPVGTADPAIALYTYDGTGSPVCDNLAMVACNDQSYTVTNYAGTNYAYTPGEIVYIRVMSFSLSPGTFSICVKENDACGHPNDGTNDFCQSAQHLSPGIGFTNSTSNYTRDTDEPFLNNPVDLYIPGWSTSMENNAWYTFTATASTMTFTFSGITCASGDGIQAIVYDVTYDANGCCIGFTSMVQTTGPVLQNGGGWSPMPGTVSGSFDAVGLVPGQNYVLMVDGWAGADCDYTVEGWEYATVDVVEICQGDSIFTDGAWVSTPGTYGDTIVTIVDASVQAVGAFCEDDASVNLTAASPGGTWSGNGITDPALGVFDPVSAGVGVWPLTYTLANCSTIIDVVVNPEDDASFAYSTNLLCMGDPNPIPTGIQTLGGTFNSTNNGSIDPATGEFDINLSGVGDYDITYVTNGICPDSSMYSITVSSCTLPISAFAMSDNEICEGECIDLTDQSSDADAIEWVFSGTNLSGSNEQNLTNVCFENVGVYTILQIVSNSFGSDSLALNVVVHPNPVVLLGADIEIDFGESTLIGGGAGSGIDYSWTPSESLECDTCASTLASPAASTTYTLTATDQNDCVDSSSITVFVINELEVYVPNAFTPNGDEFNNTWNTYMSFDTYSEFHIQLFNRWGQVIWESFDPNVGWDGIGPNGKIVQDGIYSWRLTIRMDDKKDQLIRRIGHVSVVK